MKTIKSIRDLLPRPSDAVRAMIEGLEEQSKREDFVIDMSTFGSTSRVICYGCAATCTIQKIFNVRFTPKNIISSQQHRIKVLRAKRKVVVSEMQLEAFESTVDSLRHGGRIGFVYLLTYYGYSHKWKNSLKELADWCANNLIGLTSTHWKERLPKFKELQEKLIKIGY